MDRVSKSPETERQPHTYAYDGQQDNKWECLPDGFKPTGERDEEMNSLIDDVAETIVVPPDGGYGWIVVAASFFCNLLLDGIICTAGQAFNESWEQYYGVSSANAAWVTSILTGCYLLVGPLVSALANMFGCRISVYVGATFIFVGFLISIFAQNITVLMFTFGALGGIGFGFIYMPSVVIVSHYFHKRRALATGLAVCGSGIGAAAFAPLTNFLRQEFGWQGAILILAAISLNFYVLGYTFKMPEPDRDQIDRLKSQYDAELDFTKSISNEPGCDTLGQYKSSSFPGFKPQQSRIKARGRNRATTTISRSRNHFDSTQGISRPYSVFSIHSNTTGFSVPRSLIRSKDAISTVGLSHLCLNRPLLRPDTFLQTSLAAIPTSINSTETDISSENCMCHKTGAKQTRTKSGSYRSLLSSFSLGQAEVMSKACLEKGLQYSTLNYSKQHKLSHCNNNIDSVSRYIASTINLDDVYEVASADERGSFRERLIVNLKLLLRLRLIRSPTFALLCLSGFLTLMGYFVPFVYLPRLAIKSLGIPEAQATSLIQIMGITNIVCRVACGWLSDQPRINALAINNGALIAAGITSFLVPHFTAFWMFCGYAIIFGTATACCSALRAVIAVDLLGLENLNNAFGVILMFMGMASLVGSPIAGAVKDATGDYKVSFYCTGAVVLIAGVVLLPVKWISDWENAQFDDSVSEKNSTSKSKDEKDFDELNSNGHNITVTVDEVEIKD